MERVHESLGMLAEDGCGGQGSVNFRVSGVDLTFLSVVTERQYAVFEGADAVQSPLRVDDGLGALAFGEGFGREIDEEFFGERFVSGEVFGGQDYDARGQAVTQSVQAGGLLSDLSTRTRTLLGVAAIGFQLDGV
jgi:hypothetical protein